MASGMNSLNQRDQNEKHKFTVLLKHLSLFPPEGSTGSREGLLHV